MWLHRVLPLPPKPTRFLHKAKQSIPFDVTKALVRLQMPYSLKSYLFLCVWVGGGVAAARG